MTRLRTVGSGRRRDRFQGEIAGVGFTSGVRAVIGRWEVSPFGAFGDVMLQRPGRDGERILFAPSAEIADYISATYTFDRVMVQPLEVRVGGGGWEVESADLRLGCVIGRRTAIGRLLRPVPAPLLTAPAFSAAADPIARVLLPGVRTAGEARPGRREYYGAVDQRAVTAAEGSLEGRTLGRLAPVWPPCTFGFSSTPRQPVVTRLVTTVDQRPNSLEKNPWLGSSA